jgi:hypothetical protein
MTYHKAGLTLALAAHSAEGDEFFKKIIQSAKENGIIIVSVPAISAFIEHLPEWMDTLEKGGINFRRIATLKFPELSLRNTREHQGTTDANKQEPYQPRSYCVPQGRRAYDFE